MTEEVVKTPEKVLKYAIKTAKNQQKTSCDCDSFFVFELWDSHVRFI